MLNTQMRSFGNAVLLVAIIFCSLALATLPGRASITIAPHNQLLWPTDGKAVTLIINIFDERDEYEMLDAAQKRDQITTWLADFFEAEFEGDDRSSVETVTGFIISVADMDEYGSSGEQIETIAKLDYERSDGSLVLVTFTSDIDFAVLEGTELAQRIEASVGNEPNLESATYINLPTTFYLVEGIAQTFYLENIGVSDNPFEFVYITSGADPIVSQRKQRHVEFLAPPGSAGSYQLNINVRDYKYEEIQNVTLQVEVVPSDVESQGDPLNILVVGHSLATIWPAYLHEKFVERDTFDVNFIGSLPFFHALPDVDEEIQARTRRDASSAFSVNNLLNRSEPAQIPDPNQPAESPYLYDQGDGSFAIDMARYRDEKLGGQVPDVILINTGDNDIWAMPVEDPAARTAMLATLKSDLNELIGHYKDLNPNVKIGLLMPPNYNRSELAWTLNYGADYNRVEQLRRRYFFMQTMKEIASETADVVALATEFVNDADNDFPFNSGTHLTLEGLSIFVEPAYAWIKSTLTQ